MRDVAECRQAKATPPKPAAIRDSIFPLQADNSHGRKSLRKFSRRGEFTAP